MFAAGGIHLFPSRPPGPSAAKNTDDKMSFAQKEWPGGGRILMAGINTANAVSPGRGPLSGGVALVTGGSRGIGRVLGAPLAALGASVGICGRDRAALANSASELDKTGVRVFYAVADVTRSADIASLVAETEAAFGPLTIL